MSFAPEKKQWWDFRADTNNTAKLIYTFDEDHVVTFIAFCNADASNARLCALLRRPPGNTTWDLRESLKAEDMPAGDAKVVYQAAELSQGYLCRKGSSIGFYAEDKDDCVVHVKAIRIDELYNRI